MDALPERTKIFTGSTQEFLEEAILKSRYFLIPLYFALLLVIVTIMFDFFHVFLHGSEGSNLNEHILKELELLDITMIANLIWLISAGSYYVFVDNYYPSTSGKKRPRCLAHISSGILKEKMAGSIVGVSSVYLLQVFLHLAEPAQTVDWPKMGALLAIHAIFIIGLLAFNKANEADHHNHDEEKKHATAES